MQKGCLSSLAFITHGNNAFLYLYMAYIRTQYIFLLDFFLNLRKRFIVREEWIRPSRRTDWDIPVSVSQVDPGSIDTKINVADVPATKIGTHANRHFFGRQGRQVVKAGVKVSKSPVEKFPLSPVLWSFSCGFRGSFPGRLAARPAGVL
jgi:hypothetical protein